MKQRSFILQRSFLPARWLSDFCFRSLNIFMPWQLDLQMVWFGYLDIRGKQLLRKEPATCLLSFSFKSLMWSLDTSLHANLIRTSCMFSQPYRTLSWFYPDWDLWVRVDVYFVLPYPSQLLFKTQVLFPFTIPLRLFHKKLSTELL